MRKHSFKRNLTLAIGAISLLGFVSQANAILLERSNQGSYNTRPAPKVNILIRFLYLLW
ncbi:hypothetical protein [Lonepinella sp. BR2271]|uniref:hypothetical protein n=1 Tax=Lonepinella sp. BR2271 TaxID=3434550 RepID=UPI003F6DF256